MDWEILLYIYINAQIVGNLDDNDPKLEIIILSKKHIK